MTTVLEIGQFLLTLVEVGLCYVYCDLVFGRENQRKYHMVVKVVMILGLAGFWQVNRNIVFINHTIYLVLGSICAVSVWWIYRAKCTTGLSVTLSYYTVLGLIHTLFSFVALLFLKDEKFMETVYHNISICRLLVLLASIVAVGVAYIWLSGWINFSYDLVEFIKWQLIIFSLFSRWMIAWGQVQIVKLGYQWIIWSFGSLVFTLAMIGVVCGLFAKRLKVESETKLTIQKEQMMNSFYNEIKTIHENSLYTTHDMKNHVLVLRKYAEDGEIDKIRGYLDKISVPIDTLRQYIMCENEIINLIINTKILEAKKKNIKVITAVENCTFEVAEHDLCSVLSNLMDNAVEACEKVDVGERWIQIHMMQRVGCSLIKVVNSIAEQPKMKNGVYLTNKSGSHGYGLKSVQSVVNKYHGTMKCSHNEETFSVVISLMQEGR